MLSFIHKHLPSKERNDEHQIAKNDESMKNFKSEEKKKTKASSTIDALVVGPSTSLKINQLNESYSAVDYFPMRSGNLAETVNDEKITSSHDCYFNPSENIEAKNDVQTTVIKS